MCVCKGLPCLNFSEIRVSTLLATSYSNRRGFEVVPGIVSDGFRGFTQYVKARKVRFITRTF